MKKYLYLIFSFLLLFCTKKKVDLAFLSEKNTENIENRNFSVAFSRFEEDYYFWSELDNFENASLFFVDLKDKNGKKLSGKYTISYGIYDDILEDAIIPNTLTTETLSFFEGSATFSIDLSDLLTRGNLQNREAWFWFEFIFYDKNNLEVAKIKIGTLVKQKREFKIDIIDFYSFDDHTKNSIISKSYFIDFKPPNALPTPPPDPTIEPLIFEMIFEIELDISDPLFQLPPKTLAPNFYVKFNDEIPKLYTFQADYTTNKAYLTLSSSQIPTLSSDLRLLIWHQVGTSTLVALVRVGQPQNVINRVCRMTEEELLKQSPFNLATVVGSYRVTEMYLVNKNLTSLPETLSCFLYLTNLDLRQNKFTSFPTALLKLQPQLMKLNLAANQLSSLLENLSFPNLRLLNLSENRLTTFPKVFNASLLHSLELHKNQLSSLPENLSFPNLRLLNLSENRLTTFPKVFNASLLHSLELHKNQLSSLPENLSFPNLRLLNLSENQLNILPKEWSSKNLETLILNHNKFSLIPDLVWQFTALSLLNLSGNPVKTLPETIEQLKVLEYAYFENNALTSLPESIFKLINLSELNLYSNTLIVKGQPFYLSRTYNNSYDEDAMDQWCREKQPHTTLISYEVVRHSGLKTKYEHKFWCDYTWEGDLKNALPRTKITIKNRVL